MKKSILATLLILISLQNSSNAIEQINEVKCNEYIYSALDYSDMIKLNNNNKDQHLKDKAYVVLNTPVVDNTINTDIQIKNNEKIGDFIRVASWNISRGFNNKRIIDIFNNQDKLIKTVHDKFKNKKDIIKEQMNILKASDIIVLPEVDVGMPRTEYVNVAKKLAESLKYNYTYGVEFLEVDPGHLGIDNYKWTEEKFLFPDKEYKVDKHKYRGLHGSAILSKFPFENARIIRLPKVYDWFNEEKYRISELESIKRNAASVVFKEEMIREIRVGSRMALVADIRIPNFEDPVTVVCVHLENRTIPKHRKKQLKFLLKKLHGIKNPVILAGDFNTTCNDGSPTGVLNEIKKKLKDKDFIARNIILAGNPYGLAISSIAHATMFLRQYSNPTVHHIPIVSPNKERGLFNLLEDFEFEDDYCFDFRGQSKKSANGSFKKLANSNERELKGFKPTFIFERPLWIGKYKLDWIFVKSYIDEPDDNKASNKFAPHFGKTLFELNYGLDKPLSDHAPITVDLPLSEYKKLDY